MPRNGKEAASDRSPTAFVKTVCAKHILRSSFTFYNLTIFPRAVDLAGRRDKGSMDKVTLDVEHFQPDFLFARESYGSWQNPGQGLRAILVCWGAGKSVF